MRLKTNGLVLEYFSKWARQRTPRQIAVDGQNFCLANLSLGKESLRGAVLGFGA